MTTVLVTGASSTLGSAIVEQLLRRGVDVVATVRYPEAAQKVRALESRAISGASLTIDRLEMTDAAAARDVVRRHRPEVVINNAGSALLGAVVDIDDDAARDQLEVLVIGPVRLARLAVLEGSCTRIVQIGSIVAAGDVPFTGWYAAAKSALETLSEVWRAELRERGVSLVVVECGAIDTDVWDDAGDLVADGDDPSTAASRRNWAAAVSWLQPHFADPDEVAAIVAGAALDDQSPNHIRVGFGSAASSFARMLPDPVTDMVVRWSLRAVPALTGVVGRLPSCRRSERG